MATIRLRRRGPAGKYAIWRRYQDPRRWPEWGARLRSWDSDGPIRPGLEGEVVGPLGVRARFEVLDVDPERLTWTWVLRRGPVRLRVEHVVDEGLAAVVISGPAPAVLAAAPFAGRALTRVVARER